MDMSGHRIVLRISVAVKYTQADAYIVWSARNVSLDISQKHASAQVIRSRSSPGARKQKKKEKEIKGKNTLLDFSE